MAGLVGQEGRDRSLPLPHSRRVARGRKAIIGRARIPPTSPPPTIAIAGHRRAG